MNKDGKSDSVVVPKRLSNNGMFSQVAAETAEERTLAMGNFIQHSRLQTQSWEGLSLVRERIRQSARRDRKQKFKSLWHHIYSVDQLRQSYFSSKRKAAAGADRVTWECYGEELEVRLADLSQRLRSGSYRAPPVARVFIPKVDGGERPIGIPALEDRIEQRRVAQVLELIYETEFKGFSYGFRPKRGAHNALDALKVGIERRKINWILDADLQKFFDTICRDWLIRFLEHRIADKRVIRQIREWLTAGVVENSIMLYLEARAPQGGSIYPLLANIYMHYVFDLWVEQWRNRSATGDIIVVRYADDFVVGFERQSDASRFIKELYTRLQRFHLHLNAQKTRLIEFGRYAIEQRKRKGLSKPETFDFLGFTHILSITRIGWFAVLRKPTRKRVNDKLKELNRELKWGRHVPIRDMGKWLNAVIRGWYQYYAAPKTFHVLNAFRRRLARLCGTELLNVRVSVQKSLGSR